MQGSTTEYTNKVMSLESASVWALYNNIYYIIITVVCTVNISTFSRCYSKCCCFLSLHYAVIGFIKYFYGYKSFKSEIDLTIGAICRCANLENCAEYA